MDYSTMSDDELKEYCIKNNIVYLGKNRKPYARSTIIKNIKKNICNPIIETKEKEQLEEQETILIDKVVWTLDNTQDTNENYKKIKDNLYNIIKKCHDILYSSHSVVGIKAQNDIMKILTLHILKPQFENKESELYKRCEKLLENNIVNKDKWNTYMSYCLDINNIIRTEFPLNEWKFFILNFFKRLLKDIYNDEDNRFEFTEEITFMRIVKTISELEISEEFIDAFSTSYGDIHEAFRVYGGGKGAKELGQFFTPRKLIHSLFYGCGLNEIIKSYDNPSIYDCCMGTGGLLSRAFSNGNIKVENIYGCEAERDTIKFGCCSLLLTTKKFNSNIIKCNSLCNNPYIFTNKFDFIFTNPPFGTKTNYDELKLKFDTFKQENEMPNIDFKNIYPIKTNDGACLFTQHCINTLNHNGTCAIVLPAGQILFGKHFVKFRKYMCETVNIIKIISVEKGCFEHTKISTSIIVFQKKGTTKNVEFMEINKKCNSVKSLVSVPINKIIDKNYTFLSRFYIRDIEDKIDYTIEYKKIEEICDFLPKSKRNASYGKDEGNYHFYSSSETKIKYCDEYDYEDECLIIGTGGTPNIKCDIKFSCSVDNYIIKSKYENILTKYLYYYILNNIELLEEGFQGLGLEHISREYIEKIEVPIPSIQYQKIIIKDIEKLFKTIETINLRIEQLKEESDIFKKYNYKSNINKFFKDADKKTIEKICEINYGNRIIKNETIKGDYPCYGGGDISFYVNEYNREGFNIVIARFGLSENCIRLINEKFYLNDSGLTLKIIDNTYLLDEYIGYYLNNNQSLIYNLSEGSGQKNLNVEEFKKIEIPIPSIELQKEFIDYCIKNDQEIKDFLEIQTENEKQHIQKINKIIKQVILNIIS